MNHDYQRSRERTIPFDKYDIMYPVMKGDKSLSRDQIAGKFAALRTMRAEFLQGLVAWGEALRDRLA